MSTAGRCRRAHRAPTSLKPVRFCIKPEQQAIYSSTVANGPTNEHAYDIIKPDRAAILPTFPENLQRITRINEDWWVANKPKVLERFEDWLLSG